MEESAQTSWLKTSGEDTNKSSEKIRKETAKWPKFAEIISNDDDDRQDYQKTELIDAFVKNVIAGAIQHYLSEFPKDYHDSSADGEPRNKESGAALNPKVLADEANTTDLSGHKQRKYQLKKQSSYEVQSSPDRTQKETNPLLSHVKPPEGSKLSIQDDVPNRSSRSCLFRVLCCCLDRQ